VFLFGIFVTSACSLSLLDIALQIDVFPLVLLASALQLDVFPLALLATALQLDVFLQEMQFADVQIFLVTRVCQ
jgi:hypothetical protein